MIGVIDYLSLPCREGSACRTVPIRWWICKEQASGPAIRQHAQNVPCETQAFFFEDISQWGLMFRPDAKLVVCNSVKTRNTEDFLAAEIFKDI